MKKNSHEVVWWSEEAKFVVQGTWLNCNKLFDILAKQGYDVTMRTAR